MKINKLKFSVLLALLIGVPIVIIGLNGCEMFAGHTNPIAGWKQVSEVGCKDGEMSAEISPIPGYKDISDDVQKFVNRLPIDHDFFRRPARASLEDGVIGFRIWPFMRMARDSTRSVLQQFTMEQVGDIF